MASKATIFMYGLYVRLDVVVIPAICGSDGLARLELNNSACILCRNLFCTKCFSSLSLDWMMDFRLMLFKILVKSRVKFDSR